MPRSVTCRSTQLHDEREARCGSAMFWRGVTENWNRAPSGDTGRERHLQRLMQQLGAAAVARAARLGPRLAAAAALRGRCSAPERRAGGSRRCAPPIGETNGRAARCVGRSSARNALRMRSTAGATDGKSMTTSSAKQLAS